jgi:hypothetical protein
VRQFLAATAFLFGIVLLAKTTFACCTALALVLQASAAHGQDYTPEDYQRAIQAYKRLHVILAVVAVVSLTTTAHAQTQRNPVLPPVEFDYPFYGRVIVTRMEKPEEIRAICPNADKRILLGCARIYPGLCLVYMLPDDQLMMYDLEPDDVYRHEIGHCNGWVHGPLWK